MCHEKNTQISPTYQPTNLPTYQPTNLRLRRVLNPTRVLLIFISVFFIFTGCEKEKSIISSNLNKDISSEKFKVINGVLHIGDSANYQKNTLEIMNMAETEFREWERSLGFKSLRTWIREANDAMDQTSNMEDLALWKEKYGDILEIGETEIKPFIDDLFAQCFANREGYFFVGSFYAKSLPEKTIYLRNGTKTELEKYISYDKSNEIIGLIIENHKEHMVVRSGCPSYEEIWRKQGTEGVMLRFEIRSRTVPGQSSYNYTQIKVGLYAKRKNWLGKWIDGTAALKWMDVEFQVTDNFGVPHYEYIPTQGPSGNNMTKIEGIFNCIDNTYFTEYVLPSFDFKKGRGTSNYLDWDKYAIQCCGFPLPQCPTDG